MIGDHLNNLAPNCWILESPVSKSIDDIGNVSVFLLQEIIYFSLFACGKRIDEAKMS